MLFNFNQPSIAPSTLEMSMSMEFIFTLIFNWTTSNHLLFCCRLRDISEHFHVFGL